MELSEVESRCWGCLSIERTVTALTSLRPTYEMLIQDFVDISTHRRCPSAAPRLCWECSALLARVAQLKQRVHRGRRALLRYYSALNNHTEEAIYKQTLSRLIITSRSAYDLTYVRDEDSSLPCKEEGDVKVEDEFYEAGNIDASNGEYKFEYPFTQDESKDFDTYQDVVSDNECVAHSASDTTLIVPKLEEGEARAVSKSKRERRSRTGKKSKAQAKVKRRERDGAVKTEWRCRVCGQSFVTRGKMTYHQRTVHADPVLCNECGRVFSFKPTLEKHMVTHFGGTPQYPCAVCGKSFAGRAGIKSHMIHVHSAGSESYRCEPCDLTFKTKYKYRTHLKWSKRHGGEGTEKHECDKCHRRYKTKQRLFEHYSYQHLGKAAHKCNICSKEISSLLGLQKHMKYVHEGWEKPRTHVCETCGDAFKQVSMLRQHQYIHTGEKPYACDECGATFRQKGSLYTHRRLVHLKIKRGHAPTVVTTN